VVKTTVYIPEDLKHALQHVARLRGRSEADVIREAIRHEVAQSEPSPTFPVFHSGDLEPFAERDEELLDATGFGL
jgi:ribbon-helix-helix CopG family protein